MSEEPTLCDYCETELLPGEEIVCLPASGGGDLTICMRCVETLFDREMTASVPQ